MKHNQGVDEVATAIFFALPAPVAAAASGVVLVAVDESESTSLQLSNAVRWVVESTH